MKRFLCCLLVVYATVAFGVLGAASYELTNNCSFSQDKGNDDLIDLQNDEQYCVFARVQPIGSPMMTPDNGEDSVLGDDSKDEVDETANTSSGDSSDNDFSAVFSVNSVLVNADDLGEEPEEIEQLDMQVIARSYFAVGQGEVLGDEDKEVVQEVLDEDPDFEALHKLNIFSTLALVNDQQSVISAPFIEGPEEEDLQDSLNAGLGEEDPTIVIDPQSGLVVDLYSYL